MLFLLSLHMGTTTKLITPRIVDDITYHQKLMHCRETTQHKIFLVKPLSYFLLNFTSYQGGGTKSFKTINYSFLLSTPTEFKQCFLYFFLSIVIDLFFFVLRVMFFSGISNKKSKSLLFHSCFYF